MRKFVEPDVADKVAILQTTSDIYRKIGTLLIQCCNLAFLLFCNTHLTPIPSFLFLSRLRKSFTQEWGEAYRRKIPAVIHIEVCAFALAVQFHHIRWSQRTTSVIFRQMLIKVQEQAPQHFHVILPLWATDLCAPYRLIGGGRRLFISSLM